MSSKLASGTPEVSLSRRRLQRMSSWALLVSGSFAVLVAGVVLLGVWWLATSRTTSAAYYTAPGARIGIEVSVQSGDVTIVGGSTVGAFVNRTDHSVFGHGPRERLAVRGGVLRLVSSCPQLVVGSCTSSYRLVVPDDVPIHVHVAHGNISIDGYQGSADVATTSGAITVEGYCGPALGATSASGDVSVSTACAPKRLVLRSDSGNVSVLVPAGDYRIDAASGGGRTTVHGLINDNSASRGIDALSNGGNVTVALVG